jgi:EF hand domain-containing protein
LLSPTNHTHDMKLKKTFFYGFSILSLTCLSSAQDAPKGPPPEGGKPGGPPPAGQPGGRPPDGRPQGGPQGGGDPGARLAEFIKRADADNDGKISKEEFANLGKKESEERFGKMDGNSDGFVDQDEIGKLAQMMRQGGQGGQGMRRPDGGGPPGEGGGFRRPPGSEGGSPGGSPGGQAQGGRPGGDGGPRGGSMFGDPKENFKRMDADGNGSVSEDEYIKASEKMREMMRNRGGMGRPGEGGGPKGPGGAPGGAGGPPGEAQGGFRRPPAEGDAPKSPAPALTPAPATAPALTPAPATAPDKPKE